jgi:hypothetical protein
MRKGGQRVFRRLSELRPSLFLPLDRAYIEVLRGIRKIHGARRQAGRAPIATRFVMFGLRRASIIIEFTAESSARALPATDHHRGHRDTSVLAVSPVVKFSSGGLRQEQCADVCQNAWGVRFQCHPELLLGSNVHRPDGSERKTGARADLFVGVTFDGDERAEIP